MNIIVPDRYFVYILMAKNKHAFPLKKCKEWSSVSFSYKLSNFMLKLVIFGSTEYTLSVNSFYYLKPSVLFAQC